MDVQISVLRPLSAGGNGDCYLGILIESGEQVVIKYLRDCHLPDRRKAFAREVKVLARSLQGLVPILFADLNAAKPYYVMPYFPGGAVRAHAGRLNRGQLCAIAEQVASTLAGLHESFVIHGDIKPDNILVGADGQLQVADPLGSGMGCTVLFSEHHGGTPGYWGPEVKAGAAISQASDAYSFGATMYHLATGRIPTDGERLRVARPASDSDQGISQAMAGYGSPVTYSPSTIPTVIREIVDACCDIDPLRRPSMTDVVRMLKGESLSAIRETRRNWRIAAGILAAVGLLAALDTQLSVPGSG